MQPLGQHADEERDADDAVHREERRVEPREVVGLDERMLIDEQPGGDDDAERVVRRRRPCRRTSPRRPSARHVTVQRCSTRASSSARRSPKRDRQRIETLASIERDVLQRVQDVEAAAPRRHGERERDQHPPRMAPLPRHGEIAADRRDRHADAEHEVAPARESLGVAVEQHPPQRDRRQHGAERIEPPRRDRRRAPTRSSPAAIASVTRSAPLGISRCRVRGLRASISRSTMRLNPIAAKRAQVNASTIQPTIAPRHRRAIRREHDADQRERQREQRVRQLHEIHIDEPARAAMRERLAFASAGARCGVRAHRLGLRECRATSTSRPPSAWSRRPSRSRPAIHA